MDFVIKSGSKWPYIANALKVLNSSPLLLLILKRKEKHINFKKNPYLAIEIVMPMSSKVDNSESMVGPKQSYSENKYYV